MRHYPPTCAKPWLLPGLDDKYTLKKGRVYMSGTQALVRLPMLQIFGRTTERRC